MDAKPRPAINPEDEDFEPSTDWIREDECDTLLVFLPGFRMEKLKVQVTSTLNLRISGERLLGNNKYSRFRKEFPIPSYIDNKGISAKFEDGILFVKQPKIITPSEPPAEAPKPQKPTNEAQKPAADAPKPQKPANEAQKPVAETPEPQKPTNEPRPQKSNQENAAQQVTSMTSNEKITNAANDNKVPQETPGREKVPNNTNETSSITKNNSNNVPQKSMEKQKDDELDKKGKVTSTSDQKHENLGDYVDKAAKEQKGAAGTISGNREFRYENYNTSFGDWVEELKKSRNLMNLVVAVLLVLILMMYAKKDY